MRLLAACICTIKSTTCTEFRARESGYGVGIKWSWFGLPQPRCLTNAFVSGYSSSVYLSISPQGLHPRSPRSPRSPKSPRSGQQSAQGNSANEHAAPSWTLNSHHLRIWCNFFNATKIMKLQTFSVLTHTRLILGDILLDQCRINVDAQYKNIQSIQSLQCQKRLSKLHCSSGGIFRDTYNIMSIYRITKILPVVSACLEDLQWHTSNRNIQNQSKSYCSHSSRDLVL